MVRSDDQPGDNVSALRRGFEVLSCIADAGKPLGNAEISQRTGIPRPTVTRLVATLVSLGHARPAPDSERFELAAGVVRLAEAFYGGLDLRRAARPHLVKLAESTGASSLLGVREGDEMLVIEAARLRSAVVHLAADVGTRMALPTSALGRAWLSGIDGDARAAVLAQLRRTRPRGGPAIDAGFEAMLDRARSDGFALSLGEWHPNINAVAVPVRTAAGEVVSINCGGPSFAMSAERLRSEALPAVVEAAAALAADIGGKAGAALHLPAGQAVATRSAALPTSARGSRRANQRMTNPTMETAP